MPTNRELRDRTEVAVKALARVLERSRLRISPLDALDDLSEENSEVQSDQMGVLSLFDTSGPES